MLDTLLGDYRFVVQYAIFVGLAAFAWLRGDEPEKGVGLVFVAAIAVEIIHHSVTEHRTSEHINVIHLGLDLFMFAALAPIALRANRIYPLWILAAQLIAVLMHFQRGLVETLPPLAYWALIRLPSYLQMVAFAAGLITHRRRIRRGIAALPWRRYSPR